MKKTPIVNVKDLRVFFPQQDLPIKAVDGLSYEINQGETQAIFSESGGYVIAQCCEMFFVEMNEQSASNA